jgi:hypothetical protein
MMALLSAHTKSPSVVSSRSRLGYICAHRFTTWPNPSLVCIFLWLGPWNHVLCVGIGAYIGYNYASWEEEFLGSINKLRVARGMVPITRDSVTVFTDEQRAESAVTREK